MSGGTVVITRSAEDSAELEQAIRDAGYEPLIEPLLNIEYLEKPWPAIDNDTSLIFTSASGVRAFCYKNTIRDNPVWAVGPNTADEALKQGFSNVENANGSVEDLITLISEKYIGGSNHPMLYVRGEDVSRDIGTVLAKNDIKIDEFVAYRANLVDKLSLEFLKKLDSSKIKAIMFFSSRAGRNFSALIEQYSRIARLKPVQALCISQAVAETVSSLSFKQRLVASEPDRYGMIELLGQISVIED